MTGTVRQDGAAMAEAMVKIASNYLGGNPALSGIDEEMKVSDTRINIPYSIYTASSEE